MNKYYILIIVLLLSLAGVFLYIEFAETIEPNVDSCEDEYIAVGLDFVSATFRVEGERVYMNGELTCATMSKFEKVFAQQPQIKTIVLQQVLGSLDDEANIPFMLWIRDQGFNTHLESTSYIASGGVDFFAAGVSRTMENGAKVGIHSWYDTEDDIEGKDLPKDDPAHTLYTNYYNQVFGNDSFYWYTIYSAPVEGIYLMTNEEILKYGLVTEPIIDGLVTEPIIDDTSTSAYGKSILYVASKLTDCVGLTEQKCMLIRESEDSEWEFLYYNIQGFEFEQGYEYELMVQITKVEDPPQDASSLRYDLIDILKKSKVIIKDSMTLTSPPRSLGEIASMNVKYVNVFGVHIVATSDTPTSKILHAANVMAQYLDNDADGSIDNEKMVNTMISENSVLVMAPKFGDKEFNSVMDNLDRYCTQDLYAVETKPQGSFDATLEEVFHLITRCGYEVTYPDVFETKQGTEIMKYMDKARGGYFEQIPSVYPADAWYTYSDPTCNYGCQGGEYIYWAMTSILGAQNDRHNEIKHEWTLNTKEKVQNNDPDVYNLLTTPEYRFATTLPNGNYSG